MVINCADKPISQLVLSPLSVLPTYQHRGIGSKLIAAACDKAKDMGYQAVFLCGDFYYYSRFGFVPTYDYKIYHIDDTSKDAQWCMVKELVNGYLNDISGTIDIL